MYFSFEEDSIPLGVLFLKEYVAQKPVMIILKELK